MKLLNEYSAKRKEMIKNQEEYRRKFEEGGKEYILSELRRIGISASSVTIEKTRNGNHRMEVQVALPRDQRAYGLKINKNGVEVFANNKKSKECSYTLEQVFEKGEEDAERIRKEYFKGE